MSEAQRRASDAIGEVAAEWVIRIAGGNVSADQEREFLEWLRQSPVHVREYLSAEVTFSAMRGVARDSTEDVARLLREADANVVAMSIPPGRMPPPEALARRRAVFLSGVAASLLVMGAAVAWFTFDGTQAFDTSTGERRHVRLDDGSLVEMNARTRLKVRLTEARRDVELLAGEAFFDVAKDARRPFRVLSDSTVVRAIGTQFNVHRGSRKTTVTVVEGRVAISRAESAAVSAESRGGTPASAREAGAVVELTAGLELAIVESGVAGALASPKTVDPASATAWRAGRLVFDSDPLGEVVAEFNRYNHRQIVVADAQLGEERISGVFDADEPDALIGFLTRDGAVRVTEEGGSVVLELADH
jgi:transmembrane sensor